MRQWLKRNWPLPAAFVVWVLASWYAWWVIDPNTRELRTEWLKTSAQAGGALFLAIGLVYTHRTVENSRKTLQHQQDSQRKLLEHQSKTERNERFFKAAELLSKEDNHSAHIGALFALEQLANESNAHYHQVIEVICSFVRRRSEECRPSPDDLEELNPDDLPKAPHDIEVAVRVLGRRRYRFGDCEQQPLDLRGANLCGLYIPDADFAGAMLGRALLVDTYVLRGNLAKANLINSNFRHATFDSVLMVGAILHGGLGGNAELAYNSVLDDPRHLIPQDVGKDGKHVWTREPALSSSVNGVDYLNETTWSDKNFNGATLFIRPELLFDELRFESDTLFNFAVVLHTDSMHGKGLAIKALEESQQ